MGEGARLIVTDRLGNTKNVQLEKPVFTLGRHADSDLQMLGATVSRRHAEIVLEEGAHHIVDKSSKSGTFVNDQQVVRRQLRNSDRIRLGKDTDQELVFVDEESARSGRPQETDASADRPQLFNARTELQNLARFLEVNQALKISLSIQEVLHLIVDAAVEITTADRGALLLRNEKGELDFRVARDRNRKTLSSDSIAISRTALDRALRAGCSVVVADVDRDDVLAGAKSALQLELRRIVCIPLQRFRMNERSDATGIFSPEILGALYLDGRQPGDALSKTAVTLLESLAFEASKALESVRLMQEEAEKLRMERELSLAREVQVALLTTSALEDDHVEIAAHSLPSRNVDGDFYDLFRTAGGRTAFVLGDVSGKGIAAALLASMAQGILQTQLGADRSISFTITALNRLLVVKTASSKFITLFCGVLSPDGTFTYVNAGHNPPILLRASGELEFLTTNSMIVGAFDFAAYPERETRLVPGDVVVAFTDGVTEASGASGEMFGNQRLEQIVRSAAAARASELRDCVFREVAAFTRGSAQEDDITVLALKMR